MEGLDRLLLRAITGELSESVALPQTVEPFPRSGHRLCFINGSLWLIGGYIKLSGNEVGSHGQIMEVVDKEIWRYDPMLSNWMKIETTGEPPKTMASHAACSFGKYIIVHGGSKLPFGTTIQQNLHAFDTELSCWIKLDDHLDEKEDFIPEGVYGHSMVVVKDFLYIIGGTAGTQFFNSVHRFDLVEKKWEKVFEHIVMFNDENDVPIGRYRHECVTYMDRWIFMIAGGTSREVFSSRRVFVFDTVLKNWIQVQTNKIQQDELNIRQFQPPEVRCHSLAIDGANIYMIGGFVGTRSSASIWKLNINPENLPGKLYNPKKLDIYWVKVRHNLPKAIFFHDSVFDAEYGEIFVFGGNSDTGKRNNMLSRFRVQPATLEKISKKARDRICEKKITCF